MIDPIFAFEIIDKFERKVTALGTMQDNRYVAGNVLLTDETRDFIVLRANEMTSFFRSWFVCALTAMEIVFDDSVLQFGYREEPLIASPMDENGAKYLAPGEEQNT